jgi:surface antigen
LVVASGLVLGTPAAAAATKCSGYAGCDVAPYTNHGYDATTNHRSYWGQYVGDNCTNYVAYLLVTLDGMPDRQPWKGSGDADNWGRAEAAITDRKPAVGAIAWWPAGFHGAGSLGHVARVESVASASTIVVSEDAFPEDGMTDYSGNAYDWRVITKKSRRWPRGFIHFVATG